MSEFNITVIIPVLNRPKNIEPFIGSFNKNTPLDNVELLFITSNSCQEEIQEINKHQGKIMIGISPDDVVSWSKRINWGINYSKEHNHFGVPSSWILCCADDVVFHENWFDIAKQASEDFCGVLGTNDLGNWASICGEHATHPIVSRKYVEELGTIDEVGKFCHEGYIHNFTDCELVSTAKYRGKWKGLIDCKIEHMHPAWKKGEWDDVYQKGQNGLGHDRNLWVARAAKFGLKLN